MRTIETTIYLYDELDEKAQAKAREWWLGVGLAYDWWANIYEDASRIGFRYTGFSLNPPNRYIEGRFDRPLREVAQAILREHGSTCKTYKLAKRFLKDIKLFGNDEQDDEDIAAGFEQQLRMHYLETRQDQLDFLTSDEQVAEAIRANGYEFTADGQLTCL